MTQNRQAGYPQAGVMENYDDLLRVTEDQLRDLADECAEKAASKTVLRMAETMELTIEERLFIKDFYKAVKTGRQRFWNIIFNIVISGAVLGTLAALWAFFKAKIH